MESPPKRITRARAAAKATDGGFKIATAASKAKVARSASITKRKTRADDIPEHEECNEVEQVVEPKKSARGRPKKLLSETATAVNKSIRAESAQVDAETEADGPAPKWTRGSIRSKANTSHSAKATRGRASRADDADVITVDNPSQRVTRGRAATASKVAPKKSVTFEEPDKENIVPLATKGKAAVGIKAKPVRKPTTTRAPRGNVKTTNDNTEKPTPLSPKKATQVAIVKDSTSEDELAVIEKTPIKPLMRSPVKPPGNLLGTAKKLGFAQSIVVNRDADMHVSVMASPARRPPSTPFRDVPKITQDSQLGESLLRSPVRMTLPTSIATKEPSLKASLLQSPAKRPTSPIKLGETETTQALLRATPKAATFKISRFATPRTITRPGHMAPPSTSRVHKTSDDMAMPPPRLNFSGRLSAIVPREADVTSSLMSPLSKSPAKRQIDITGQPEPMMLDADSTVMVQAPVREAAASPSTSPQPMAYKLREADESPFLDSDSEDELASPTPLVFAKGFASMPTTPRLFESIAKAHGTGQRPSPADARSARREKHGFTPLAQQLTNWMAGSPEKDDEIEDLPILPQTISQVSPIKNVFFEDEMTVRDEMMQPEEAETRMLVEDPNFDLVELDDEDLALAHEADELSLLEPDDADKLGFAPDSDMIDQVDEEIAESAEPAPSEASQEYGDENLIPVDPALLAASESHLTMTTPKRVFKERVCHTVSKVPLKAAAENEPMGSSPVKRSLSVSKLPVTRPTSSLIRNNTVISYSPSKRVTETNDNFHPSLQDISTPSGFDTLLSTLGSPARTPHRDNNPDLLKGAIVFVDVHTTEGADACSLFKELLTQMGARCVKSWSWNGNGDESKMGITHIVFKDGGKRTLEKARETGGVVQCVGVGWVLDCERENKWLDEAPYSVDTAVVPRGGHRRRKSMEPRALANLNGTIMTCTPAKSTRSSESPSESHRLAITSSKSGRRNSVEWVRSPASASPDDKLDGDTMPLSPATPAFGATDYGEDGLYGIDTPGGQTPYFLHTENIVQKTAPVNRYNDDANQLGFLFEKKDETVMMRLMAARRKSLQWAPKIGSPLAKGDL